MRCYSPPKTGSWFQLLTEPDTNTTNQERSVVPLHQCHWAVSIHSQLPMAGDQVSGWAQVCQTSHSPRGFLESISFCQPRETHNSYTSQNNPQHTILFLCKHTKKIKYQGHVYSLVDCPRRAAWTRWSAISTQCLRALAESCSHT